MKHGFCLRLRLDLNTMLREAGDFNCFSVEFRQRGFGAPPTTTTLSKTTQRKGG